MIMRHVVYALLPIAAFSVYVFGLSALLLLLVTVGSCLLTEHLLCYWSGKRSTIGDWSAIITGLLLGMTLPPAFPLWMAFVGGVISIALGKFAFGGLGYNVFNPALVGRAVLQAAFPVAITSWSSPMLEERFFTLPSSVLTFPFMQPVFDGMSGATPLSAFKFDHVVTELPALALGMVSGSAGETSVLLIILGGAYLAIRKMMNWKIPVTILSTVFLFSALLYGIDAETYPSPFFMLMSGGLMLGAVFMASDMVGSPMTTMGMIVYGVFIGIMVVVIRLWGGLPEGVMYAILLGNALTPQLDKLIKPRVYGTSKRKIL
ncbi:RnfABCDGE type electron transport complex subunit D [Algivirga pacifica]|uniref:Ion-translocating oxidoreductase complex subunit D n=2 Tax=Algivirga pacifica TaxID=1162670 RepID=A0ABP9DHV4_9BACT